MPFFLSVGVKGLEATTGIEPVIRALQAPALPLGHVAMSRFERCLNKRADFFRAGSDQTMERKTGLEPATLTLARLCSTN